MDYNSLELDTDRLRARTDTYLMNHQIGLHTTVVGIALAIGGLALASLLGTSRLYHDKHALLWLLWLASMLSCMVVYNGVVTAAVALPSRIPTVWDLLPPLVLGASEFLLFGVLAHQATGLTQTSSVVEAWFFSFAAFCLCSVAAIVRANHLFKHGVFRAKLVAAVEEIRRILRRDARSAVGLAAVGLFGGFAAADRWSPTLLYIAAGVIIAGLSLALIGHAQRVGAVQAVLAPSRAGDRASRRHRPIASFGRRASFQSVLGTRKDRPVSPRG